MKKLAALVLTVSMLLIMTSCSFIVKNSDEQYDYPVTVGNIVFDQQPRKIAVLSENIADILIACGYEGKLAARSDACVQEAISILPSVGTPDSPDLEGLKILDVDLCLADTCFDDETAEKLESMGVTVLVIKPAADSEGLSKLYNNVAASVAGKYTGKMQAMTTYEKLRSELEAVRNNAAADNVVATTCYIYDIEGDECKVAYKSDFADQLFEYAAATNIASGDDDGVIGIDTLLKANPETIFCDTGVYEKLTAHNDLKKLKALTKGTVYELPNRYFGLQGMSCIQIADFLAAKTHSGYVQSQKWPSDLTQKKEEYKAPFEPQIDIYYTVGESYEPIKAIEERLIGLGYLSGDADETFTEETAEAVSAFQNANSLSVTGVADYATLRILLSSKAIPRSEAGSVTYTPE